MVLAMMSEPTLIPGVPGGVSQLVISGGLLLVGFLWIRHVIEYGGRIGAGMQIAVTDLDNDRDLDIVVGGKSGLFLLENKTTTRR